MGHGFRKPALSNRFLLLRRRNLARLFLGLGLGQETEARLAPRIIDADIQQSIGTPAWAGKFHHRVDSVRLSGVQGHRPSRDMVRGCANAENKIARADGVAHSLHTLPAKGLTLNPGTGDSQRNLEWNSAHSSRTSPNSNSGEAAFKLVERAGPALFVGRTRRLVGKLRMRERELGPVGDRS